MGVVVPDLRQKFRLLETYGYSTGLDDIAMRLGKKPKTLLWWATGSAVREPGRIPTDSVQSVLDLFSACLAPSAPPDHARKIIFGPASLMENWFRAARSQSLVDFIRTEGHTDKCRLYTYPAGDMQLIELEQDSDPSAQTVTLDQQFRIVIERNLRTKIVLCLQNAQGLWGRVPSALDDATGHLLIPGIRADGQPRRMRERRDTGANRFVAIVTEQTLPAEILALDGQIVDAASLDRLAYFYGQQPSRQREIHVLTVEVRKPEQSG